jgi:hypothetical protein
MNVGVPDLSKKVILEKQYFLKNSKIWELIKNTTHGQRYPLCQMLHSSIVYYPIRKL